MKILNLVLYSNNHYFDAMKDLTSTYYKKFQKVKTLYYKYTPSLQQDILLDEDVLHIKGNESLIPGILLKTLKAFEFAFNMNEEFDYIIRTNISTVVNFDLLINSLNPSLYYGGALCYIS